MTPSVQTKSDKLASTELKSSSSSNKDLKSRETNNRRLIQAADYIARKGREDSRSQFKRRVNLINEYVLKLYIKEGYDYDPELYEELETMVNERLAEFKLSDDQVTGLFGNMSGSVQSNDPGDALHRRDFDLDDYIDGTSSSSSDDPGIGSSSMAATKPRQLSTKPKRGRSVMSSLPSKTHDQTAVQSGQQSRYGGPNNEPEHYFKDSPASLPLGGPFYMRKGSNVKSNTKTGSDDFESAYESGSRFKLPKVFKRALDIVPGFLDSAVAGFNSWNPPAKEKKGYAPRMVLEKIKVHPKHGTEVISTSSRKTVDSSKPKTSPAAGSSSANTNRQWSNRFILPSPPIASRQSELQKPKSRIQSSAKKARPDTSAAKGNSTRKVLSVAVTPRKALPPSKRPPTPRPTSLPARQPRIHKSSRYSRGEPTTPTPLTTRSRERAMGLALKSATRKEKTPTKEVAFSKDVHVMGNEGPSTSPPGAQKAATSASKGKRKAAASMSESTKPPVKKKKKTSRSVDKETISALESDGLAVAGYRGLERGSTRSGWRFKK